jgi:uncharacterized protein YjhX (UPF0386 family)
MKRYLKFLSLIVLLGTVVQAGWDQSTQRFEMDCEYGIARACSDAAFSYMDGFEMIWDGKENHSEKRKKNYAKAASLYKKGCDLGDKNACASYKKLKNKKTSTSSGTQKNYKITHKGSTTTYTILGKKRCSLSFDKNKKLKKSTCKKIVNSKGVKIYCSPLKKVCKTELEVREAI